jgi:hypothetical protein
MQGPAALSVLTAAPKPGKPPPYEDELDMDGGVILYHYRAGRVDQAGQSRLTRRARAAESSHLLQGRGSRPVCGRCAGARPGERSLGEACLARSRRPSRRHAARRSRVNYGRSAVCPARGPRASASATLPSRRPPGVSTDVCRIALREKQLVQAAHIVSDASPEGVNHRGQRARSVRHPSPGV